MSNFIELDYETYSAADLKKFGAFRYASDKTTEILMCAFSINGESPEVWIHPDHCPELSVESRRSAAKLAEAISKGWPIYAHNASFEHSVSRYRMEKDMGIVPPPLSQWRCTAAMALRAGLPHSLDRCSKALKLDQLKDARGKALIKIFSIPNKQGQQVMGYERPEEFGEFVDYCIQDVNCEMEIHKALKKFDVTGQCAKTFHVDALINHRGVPVNVFALKTAQKIIEEIEVEMFAKFGKLTRGLRPTQNAKVKEFLKARGYPLDNMQAAKIEEFLDDPEKTALMKPEALEALTIRYNLGYASVKKIPTMLGCAADGDKVRGALVYYGAQRTGRWTGALIQTQNLKRPTIKDTAGAYEMLCEGCSREELETIYGNGYEVISSCIRHFIQPQIGDFYNADYAGIECRIVSWLADDEDALQAFRDGVDVYIIMGHKIFPELSIEEMERRKAADEFCIGRFVGKQAVLGCGFGMGPDKFIGTCAQYGQEISEELAIKAISIYRKVNFKIKQNWKLCNDAAEHAIIHPGRKFRAGKLTFYCEKIAGIFYLIMRLPSGRKLAYPHAKIVEVNKEFKQKDGTKKRRRVRQVAYWGKIKGQVWGTLTTYGGKLFQNATQAVAADLMAFGMCEAEKQGFEIVTLIHDEALANEHPTKSIKDFEDALATLPRWAEGLPLVAEGKIIPYYVK